MTKETNKPDSSHRAEAREIEEQLKKMREKADRLAENLKNMGADELRALKHRTRHFLEDAREHGGEYMREAGHKAQETLSHAQANMVETIRHKPLTSVAVAAGIGFVLALLASR